MRHKHSYIPIEVSAFDICCVLVLIVLMLVLLFIGALLKQGLRSAIIVTIGAVVYASLVVAFRALNQRCGKK